MNILGTILEVTAKPYEYKWKRIDSEDAQGEFTTENNTLITFDVELHLEKESKSNPDNFQHHEIVFRGSTGPRTVKTKDKMDSGNPFRVFATIQAMTRDYIKRYGNEIEMIKFSADKSAGDLGRSKLYTRFAKNWSNYFTKYKWQPYIREKSNITIIYAVNKNVMSKEHQQFIIARFRNRLKKV
jgi:hypothetical protein